MLDFIYMCFGYTFKTLWHLHILLHYITVQKYGAGKIL